MKFSKQQSVSSDTRLSRSGFFNNSSLNNSNVPLDTHTNMHSSPHTNFYMSNHIQNSENKEVEFLRIKNGQLEEKNKRLVQEIEALEKNKAQILVINSKYVDVVNRYYQEMNTRKPKKLHDPLNLSTSEAHRALEQLEKDHRNLVKHCLVMEQQIKNYTIEMEKFEVMKAQLKSVNHTTVKDLIEEIEELGQENKRLRKDNNQITYDLEKMKEECKKVKKFHSAKEKQAGDSSAEIAKMRSLINTTQQESTDKANAYESRIYELELKVERLEKQLRESQQTVDKTKTLHKQMQIQQVQHVHNYQKLQNSMVDLLKNRERALSQYSRAKSNAKNDITLNTSLRKETITIVPRSHNHMYSHSNVKNQRRSLAEKSNIVL